MSKRLGKRMVAHLGTALAQYTPKKGEQRTHEACLAWVASLSASPAQVPEEPLPNVAELQAALMEHCSKAARVQEAGSGWWSRVARLAANKGATTQGVVEVALWVEKQEWLRQVTLEDILRKWEDWSAKARADASPANETQGGPNRARPSAW